MPLAGDDWLATVNSNPTALLQIGFQFAIWLDREAPLTFIKGITVFAYEHLLA